MSRISDTDISADLPGDNLNIYDRSNYKGEGKMNAIDLFAGCGGLSKGFMDAGFNIILGVDNNERNSS